MFLDVTDMIDYNVDLLNQNDLEQSFFCLDKNDPTAGFLFDATSYFGPTFPAFSEKPLQPLLSTPGPKTSAQDSFLHLRLILGSHLAQYLRHQLEEHKGYTATVGISTNKLLSKLVGNVNKPKNQTTIVPPYETKDGIKSSVTSFIDAHDIGKIPGIGFKISQKIRARVLGREPKFEDGLVYGPTREGVTVGDVRLFPGMGPESLEDILGGPGSPRGIGGRVWGLINGVDDAEVGRAKSVPSQISIEDSYIRLDTFEEVRKELTLLAVSLIKRMRLDLTEEDSDEDDRGRLDDMELEGGGQTEDETLDVDERVNGTLKHRHGYRKWLAHPRTLRLSTRPRRPTHPDGSRTRTFNRISRSCPLPFFVFSLTESIDFLAEKLVVETLIPSFRKLHPGTAWNLSLVNIAVTNMAETAAETKDSLGRDIGRMLKRQESVLKEWKVEDRDMPPSDPDITSGSHEMPNRATMPVIRDAFAEEPTPDGTPGSTTKNHDSRPGVVEDEDWSDDEEESEAPYICTACGASIPAFASSAHSRFHDLPD